MKPFFGYATKQDALIYWTEEQLAAGKLSTRDLNVCDGTVEKITTVELGNARISWGENPNPVPALEQIRIV